MAFWAACPLRNLPNRRIRTILVPLVAKIGVDSRVTCSPREAPLRFTAICLCLLIVACASVRPEDTEAWVGQLAASLERHPVFITMPLMKTRTWDGKEIWNYVNAANVASCSSGGSLYGTSVNYAAYNGFTSCMQRVAACNNIFYVKNGTIEQYTTVGPGGMCCYTDRRLQPGFSEVTNYR
jgi:hypothetical protein